MREQKGILHIFLALLLFSGQVMSGSLQPHEPQFLLSRVSPSKNTGIDCHFPSLHYLPDLGIGPTSPAFTGGFLTTESHY